MTDPILECRQLAKRYHDGTSEVDVLRQIDLQVFPSELIAIVGNSGSGKSTLMHLLGGLDKPSGGKVLLTGKDLSTLSETEKCTLRNQQLGFVYQFHHLLPEFTTLENVCMPLLIRNEEPAVASEKAERLLSMVGLSQRLTHKIGELSGGERQRVAIARALVTNPLCVLADEPTGNLDPKNAARVFELFLELQKNVNTSVVIVTHDMRIAERAQRVLEIQEGQLVAVR